MYIVTNQIEIKKGYAEKMAPRFTSNEDLKKVPGFNRVEVSLLDDDSEDTETINVTTWWESQKDYENWVNSDAFKKAHQRPKSDSNNEQSTSPVIGSRRIKSTVLSSLGDIS